MVSNETKQKAAKTLNDVGTPFNVDYQGRNFEFCIRKLYLGTLIRISELQSQLMPVSDKSTIPAIIKGMANDAPIKARIIAVAIINCKPNPNKSIKSLFSFKKKPFNPELLDENELTDFFIKTLDSEEVNQLTDIIVGQLGVNFFFQSTVSLKGIDLLKEISKTDTDQLTQSGDE